MDENRPLNVEMEGSKPVGCVLEVTLEDSSADCDPLLDEAHMIDSIEVSRNEEEVTSVTIDEEESDEVSSSDSAAEVTTMTPKRKHTPIMIRTSYFARFNKKEDILALLMESSSDKTRVNEDSVEDGVFLLRCNAKGKSRHAYNVDDYLGWVNHSLKKQYFLFRGGKCEAIQLIDGKFCTYEYSYQRNNKGIKKRLLHQPDNDELVALVMVYSSIKGCSLKRRISYIGKFPAVLNPKQENLIVVEYSGISGDQLEKVPKKIREGSSNSVQQRGTGLACNVKMDPQECLDDHSDFVDNDGTQVLNADEKAVFIERNKLIEHLINSQTELEEVPLGEKEDTYFIVKNEDNYKREMSGKNRVYIDDCGVWDKTSVKRCWFVKIDGKYENVKYENESYHIVNRVIRSRHPPLQECDILAMRNVYGKLKRDFGYRRRISWIDSFPVGVVPKQKHIALFEYRGKYPGPNMVPHGNQKKPGGDPYVRTSGKFMKKMEEKLAAKTIPEVLQDEPTLSFSPKDVKKMRSIRSRTSLRIGPQSAKNRAQNEVTNTLLHLVQTNAFVQQALFIKRKAPAVIGYVREHLNAWRYLCSNKSSLKGVMGVDRTISLGPTHITVITYPHPNLLCRYTGESAIMMGPAMVHLDRTWYVYHSFFSHVRDQLGAERDALFEGITVAAGSEEDGSLIEALKSCFPLSALGHCIEHMQTDLREFLTTNLGLGIAAVNHIAGEIFSGLMSCSDEHEFDLTLQNLHSTYNASNPRLGKFFQKLGEDIKTNHWEPMMSGMPLIQWSLESCDALNTITNSMNGLVTSSVADVILEVEKAAVEQGENEIKAMYNDGPYRLAPHAKKYAHTKENWLAKTNKQRGRLLDDLRRVRLGNTAS